MNDAIVLAAIPQDKVQLLKDTVCKGASNDELELFVHVANRMRLDPFAKQIHAVKRWDSQTQRETMAIQVGIDGFRLVADRTGKYEGQIGPLWHDPVKGWVDVWLNDEQPPQAAKVGVLKSGFREPLWGVARFASYVQLKKDGKPNRMWAQMPDVMIAKVAEALALRKAFPNELSGVYTPDEMGQADNVARQPLPQPQAANGKPVTSQALPTPADPGDFVIKSGRRQGLKIRNLEADALAWFASECKDQQTREAAQAYMEAEIERAMNREAAEEHAAEVVQP